MINIPVQCSKTLSDIADNGNLASLLLDPGESRFLFLNCPTCHPKTEGANAGGSAQPLVVSQQCGAYSMSMHLVTGGTFHIPPHQRSRADRLLRFGCEMSRAAPLMNAHVFRPHFRPNRPLFQAVSTCRSLSSLYYTRDIVLYLVPAHPNFF
jgi:hypothetical protein